MCCVEGGCRRCFYGKHKARVSPRHNFLCLYVYLHVQYKIYFSFHVLKYKVITILAYAVVYSMNFTLAIVKEERIVRLMENKIEEILYHPC